MSECNSFSFFTSYEAAEKCRPVVEKEKKQPYVTQPAIAGPDLPRWAYDTAPRPENFGLSSFYKLTPVSWCHDGADLGFNIVRAKDCCKMLKYITKQTCELEFLPRAWWPISTVRVKLK